MVTTPKRQTVRQSKAPNLLIAPVDYQQSYQDQLNNALRLYFAQIDNFTDVINNAVIGQGFQFPDGTIQTSAYVPGSIEAYDRSASINVTSTPTILAPASVTNSNGITYNPSTGVFTFEYAGEFSLSLVVNAYATAANQFVYIYAQNNTGSGWVNNANSGKSYALPNGQYTQIVYAQAVSRVAGQQVRYYIYSNDSKVTLQTQTLPTVSPTVYVPAIRIQYSGG